MRRLRRTLASTILLAALFAPPAAAQEPPPKKAPPDITIIPTWLGRALAVPGDLDGDGTPDIVAGAPGTEARGLESGIVQQAGMVLACSGRNGRLLWKVAGTATEEQFGEVLAASTFG